MAKIHFAYDVLLLMSEYETKLMAKERCEYPFSVGDLIVWDNPKSLDQETFERYINQYFEYYLLTNKTTYRITGILTKVTNLFK